MIFYVHCSVVIGFEAELEEGHVDHLLGVIEQRINSITVHKAIFHVFFGGGKGNTLQELFFEILTRVDILGFDYIYMVVCLNLR